MARNTNTTIFYGWNNQMKIAHKRENLDGTVEYQSVREHCQNVAALASGFAKPFEAEALAQYTGLLHDIGKYSDAFQRRIQGFPEKVDHSTAGAQVAWNTNTPGGRIAAFCIGGHHSGLPDKGSKFSDASEGTMLGKMRRTPELYDDYRTELSAGEPFHPEWLRDKPDLYFLTKLLFSSLVDADYLDTEAFMSDGAVCRSIGQDIPTLTDKLDCFTAPWKSPKTELNRKRSQILECVTAQAKENRGLFSLTVPTGGGKTVASMAFALHHALTHGMSKIIYVIPYTSIIEQTQAIFESIFGKDNVVAHYAGVEYPHDESFEQDKRYLATENWDAPIIVTTSVQFFESIYGNRPSKCRKLHNIADSVLIFDEAQMIPVSYLRPCVLAIANLVRNFRCSAVLCTATQPALTPMISEFDSDAQVKELCPDDMFADPIFERVTYRQAGKLSDEELGEKLSEETQVLCVVNSRKQAQAVYRILPEEGRYHLSTAMTPMHRKHVLKIVRERLQSGKVCRVVSTCLIEAGVDIDFPTVYRELAGLDSVLQAGGRCNREGRRDKDNSIVYIFETDRKVPEAIWQNCTAAMKVISSSNALSSKASVHDYFAFLLYTLKDEQALDQKNILNNMQNLAFETIAKDFKLITGADYIIYVRCPEDETLLQRLKQYGPSMALLRELGQYAINVYERQFRELLEEGALEQLTENAAILMDRSRYNLDMGLLLEKTAQADNYII